MTLYATLHEYETDIDVKYEVSGDSLYINEIVIFGIPIDWHSLNKDWQLTIEDALDENISDKGGIEEIIKQQSILN